MSQLLKSKIEAILFISPRPLSIAKLSALTESDKAEVEEIVDSLAADYRKRGGGVLVLRHGADAQIITNPEVANLVSKFLKDETTGELTRPSLETLSIVAYRGPITKSDLERIRGVNCSMILRNLMMRGLITAEEDKKRLITFYGVSSDFLRFLGLTHIKDMPQYESLHNPEVVEQLLSEEVVN